MNKELNTFITNTGSLNERIERATGIPDLDGLLAAMKTRENNQATDLLIGSACNVDCVSCFFQEKGGAGVVRLTPEVVEDIRQTARVLGGPLFTLYPKEITTALPLLPVFSEQGITRTLTNAKLLGKPGMLETLKNAGIKELMITVPGQAEAYATYTRENPQSYDMLLTNIDLAVQNGFTVGVFYPVFTQNIEDVVPTTLTLQNLGVSDIKFIRVSPMGAAQQMPNDMLLDTERTLQFLYNVNDARNLTERKIELTLFGGSFGPNFYGKSIYRYLSGQSGRWPASQYACPMINGQYIGISYGSGEKYPCFMALGFPELQNIIPAVTSDALKTNLRGQCASDSCEYQPLCLSNCLTRNFAAAIRRGESEPLYAGADICVTKIIEQNQ